MASYDLAADKSQAAHTEHYHELGLSGADKVDLNSNASGRIQNPLAHIPRDQLLRNVDAFADEHQLDDIRDLLRKGAQVAANPPEYRSVEGLDAAELTALEREISHKWSHPSKLYSTIILCSIGAAVQGWDQTGSNGANLSFPEDL